MNRSVFSIGTIVLALALAAGGWAAAAPPGEVEATLVFAGDKLTLSWAPTAGADRYNVYRGSAPDGSDLACHVFRTTDTAAELPESPSGLYVYVVAAWNAEGEGPLGFASDATPRLPLVACTDDDLDGVRDDQDNCPAVSNADQADQNLDGLGDPCDPATYSFENDTPGARPAEMTQDGDSAPGFVVRDYAGDLGVAYDGGVVGVHDRFDRLPAWLSFQDLDVHLDTPDTPGQTITVELWSESTFAENAGGGLQLRVEADGRVAARSRRGGQFTPLGDALLAPFERLRLRLRKGPGDESTLHVDRWDGTDWVPDAASFAVADDRLLFGRGLAVAQHDGGRRPVTRLTGEPLAPPAPFSLRRGHDGLTDWKLFQRGPAEDAPLPLPFAYRAAAPVRLEARVVETATGAPLPGHDFADHGWDLDPAPDGASGQVTIPGVPAGGNYDVEARLVDPSDDALLGEDAVVEIAVGDVFLAVGQSNMAGYSGGLDPVEPPVDEVHLFGNDYRWKRAVEPMDSGVDQVDLVSNEAPAHSLMLSFAKTVQAATGVPVAIVPAPLGGTNLHTQWQRRPDDPSNRGTLYGSSLHRVLAQGFAHPIRGVLWYQGESDTGRGTEAYLADLQQLVDDYRTDLAGPALFFGNCQLATFDLADLETWTAIQEAQRRQAAQDALSAVIGLVDQSRADNIHLDVAGYREAGRRLGRAVLAGSYGLPQDLGPQIVSIAFTSAQRRRLRITYDKPVVGGEAVGLFRVTDAGGNVPLQRSTTSGNTVEVRLNAAAGPGAVISYGYSRFPGADWIVAADGSGAALAFRDLAIDP